MLRHGNRTGAGEQAAVLDLCAQLSQLGFRLFITDAVVYFRIRMRDESRHFSGKFRLAKLLQQRADIRLIRKANRHIHHGLQQPQHLRRIVYVLRVRELHINQIHR